MLMNGGMILSVLQVRSATCRSVCLSLEVSGRQAGRQERRDIPRCPVACSKLQQNACSLSPSTRRPARYTHAAFNNTHLDCNNAEDGWKDLPLSLRYATPLDSGNAEEESDDNTLT